MHDPVMLVHIYLIRFLVVSHEDVEALKITFISSKRSTESNLNLKRAPISLPSPTIPEVNRETTTNLWIKAFLQSNQEA